MHTPVFFRAVVHALQIRPEGRYIDGTTGEGGFVTEILAHHGHVLALDADSTQIKRIHTRYNDNAYFTPVVGNFAEVASHARDHGFVPVDAVLFDLGLSMRQLRESGKGFSYRNHNEPLDMRLIRGTTSVSDLITSSSEDQLYEIFSKYAEEIYSRSISRALVRARSLKHIETVGDLVQVLDTWFDRNEITHKNKQKAILARIFQALRIAVNNEFENLKQGLSGALSILRPGGRIVVISFHSLEDRIVKQFMLSQRVMEIKLEKEFTIPNHRFERSAYLRVMQRE